MRYSHPLFPTQTRESSYRGTICFQVYKRQGSLAVGAILASLSVRTTTDIFRVGGKNLGMLDASGGSLALLFVDRTSGAGL